MSTMEGGTWPISGAHMAEEFGRQLVPAPVELVAGFLLPVLHRLPDGAFGILLDEDPFVDQVPAVDLGALVSFVYPGRVPGSSKPLTIAETTAGITVTGGLAAVQFAASAESLFLPIELSSGWALAQVSLTAPG